MKLFVIKQSKRCKFMPKCTKIRVAAGLRSDPLRELMRSRRPSSRNGGGATSTGKEVGRDERGRKGRGKGQNGEERTTCVSHYF